MNRQRAGLGISLIVLATACFGALDTTIKYLGAFMPVLLIVWARYTFQAVVMLVWLARSKTAGFRPAHPKFQLARGSLLLATSAMGAYGVQYLPVAEFTAINMLTPVGVTLLAAWFLDERVSRRRWALVFGCLAGALIVIRPGSGLFGWAVLLPLGAASTYAGFQVLTRKLAGLENPFTTHFFTGLTGFLVLTPLLLLSPIDVRGALASASVFHLALLLEMGLMGTTGHLLLILAFGLAPTATLMPFIYLQIATAAAVSWAVFGYVPDGWAWLGMCVIVVFGAASAWLNVHEAAHPKRKAPVTVDTLGD